MTSDLRSFLAEVDNQLTRVKKEVDPLTQLGSLSSQSDRPIMFENLKGYPGWKIVDRLHSTPDIQAMALRTTREKLFEDVSARMAQGKGESKMLTDGPVKESIVTGEDVDLLRMPICYGSEGDAGPYIGAAMCVTKDPATGIQNQAYYRTHIKGRNQAAIGIGRREAWRTYKKYEAQGEPMPIALVIGHHPAYEIAAAYTGPHEGFEEFELAASLLQEPVEFVACETVDLRVPAYAEIVIEGVLLPDVWDHEGQYGDYTGYYGTQEANTLDVKAITMRKDAIYRHLNTTRFTDMHVLHILAGIDGRVKLQQTFGAATILDVYRPPSAALTVILQMAPQYEGHSRQVILTALGVLRRAKIVIAVDDDIDIRDLQDVMWALSYRVNPAVDIFTLDGMQGFHLDASTPQLDEPHRINLTGQENNGILGIDATKPSIRKPVEREKFIRARPMGDGKVFLKDFL
ncbi:MAG: UbiD family decarboxylase [Chloroflexi bacterium]|nr:UbiD family decarboxylase [Chloroflexota bacterium]